ncbi:MAG TPA: hypothetical protein VI461_17860 [Chitinophagaceae bacterium]|nr:hypothetical protein [Chitinophagaceae bacterium]
MKVTITNILFGGVILLSLFSCGKSQEDSVIINHPANNEFIKYTIKAGEQYCDQNPYKQTNYSELKFIVKFDSSAVYQTLSPANQLDVNKLYGFSDSENQHHQFSARFGWRWSEGALRFFAYVYNNGVMNFEELGTISIGAEHDCSIKVNSSRYIFTLDHISKTMPRASLATTAVGYQLYPYFGGDEKAPHDIYIWIKPL